MYQKQLMSLQKTLSSLGIHFSIEKMDSKTLARFLSESTRKAIELYGYPFLKMRLAWLQKFSMPLI